MTVKNKIRVYICEHCKGYCESQDCYTCDKRSAKLTSIENTWENDIVQVQQILDSLERHLFDVMLSEFGDCPAEIKTISVQKEEVLSLLQTNSFILSGISAATREGSLCECVGIAFLEPIIKFDTSFSGLIMFTE